MSSASGTNSFFSSSCWKKRPCNLLTRMVSAAIRPRTLGLFLLGAATYLTAQVLLGRQQQQTNCCPCGDDGGSGASMLHHSARLPGELIASGSSKPPTGRDKLCVVVPFRDRFDELLAFVPHLSAFLKEQGVNGFEFVIVNQVDGFRFNRASLINVGFRHSKER